MILYGTDNLDRDSRAYELLALAANEHWNFSALPEIRREEGGKPYFPDFSQNCFNLSHSGTLALCGLDDSPLGVDIQVVKQWRPRLPARVCCQRELDWLDRQDDPDLGFAILWALKEAAVKQSGLGLRTHIRDIQIPLPECWNGPVFLNDLWFQVYSGADWAAAACGLTPPPAKILWKSLNFFSLP